MEQREPLCALRHRGRGFCRRHAGLSIWDKGCLAELSIESPLGVSLPLLWDMKTPLGPPITCISLGFFRLVVEIQFVCDDGINRFQYRQAES